jgi:hypothetical protein
MNIVFSNYDSVGNPYYGGGGAVSIKAVAEKLSEMHNVEVICGKYPGSKDKSLHNVKYKFIGATSGFSKLDQLLFPLFALLYSKKISFDVWFESFTPPFFGSMLPILFPEKIVGLAHFYDPSAMKDKYKLPFLTLTKFFIKKYKRIISLNDYQRKVLKKESGGGKVVVIPNPKLIDDSDKYITNNSRNYILFIGRIDIYQKV